MALGDTRDDALEAESAQVTTGLEAGRGLRQRRRGRAATAALGNAALAGAQGAWGRKGYPPGCGKGAACAMREGGAWPRSPGSPATSRTAP